MKKTLALCLVAMTLLCVAAAALTACAGQLSGTYKTEAVLGAYTAFTFKGNQVTVSAGSAVGTIDVGTGTYEIQQATDGSKTIKLTFGDDAKSYSGTFAYETVDGGIKIAGVTYKK